MADIQLTAQQRGAVEDRGGSLLVSAAAGSGKTKVLVERVFAYLTEEHCHIDDFLIITFTRAAAAELRTKLAAELAKRVAQDPENSHLRQQMFRVYQADIKTVDGFCAGLLREHIHLLEPVDGRSLTPDFRILDETEAGVLKQRALEDALEAFYQRIEQGDEGCRALAETLGFGRDDRALAALVPELHGKLQSHPYPDKWLEKAAESWANLPERLGDSVYGRTIMEDTVRRASYWAGRLERAVKDMEDCESVYNAYGDRFLETAAQLREYAAAAREGWDAMGRVQPAFRRMGVVKGDECAGAKDAARAVLEKCRDALKKLSAPYQTAETELLGDLQVIAPAMRALLALTGDFDKRFRAEKVRRNAMDFSDQEHYAVQMLCRQDGTPTELGEQVSRRYREIMVDEYQDSNGVQDAIFEALTREKQNCFMVGDVKQSIYQFRLADPGIFLEKYEKYVPAQQAEPGQGRKILLSHNFRSGAEVIDAVNDVFHTCMRPKVGGLTYGEAEELREGIPHTPLEAAVELHVIETRDDQYPEEAAFVAERIVGMLREGTPVRDGDSLRPVCPEDIVILLRSPGSGGGYFQKALEARGIRCASGGGTDLLQTEEIGTLRSFLQIIWNPRQDIPLVSTLASPIFGFTADELAAIRSARKKGAFYDALLLSDSPKVKTFLNTLDRLRREARMNPLTALLENCFALTRLDSVYAAMPGGEAKAANIQTFYQLAADFESGNLKDLGQFLDFLDAMEEKGLISAALSPAGCVTIMSIHKSKGLEFPVVFLSNLSRRFNTESQRAQILCDKDLGLGLSVADSENRVRYSSVAKRAIAAKMAAESLSEELRVLYVAMTRARDRLIMTYGEKNPGKVIQDIALRQDFDGGELLCREAARPGQWVLMAAVRHTEAGALHALGGRPGETKLGDHPWVIRVSDAPESEDTVGKEMDTRPAMPDGVEQALQEALSFQYAYDAATRAPSKQTATNRKGRAKDEEAAEDTQEPKFPTRDFRHPSFLTESRGGKAYGSAIHAVLQYLRYENCGSEDDVKAEIARLVSQKFITEEQGKLADSGKIAAFFDTEIGRKLRTGCPCLREFKFSILDDGSHYGDGLEGEQVLLQGVVDCALLEKDGIVVLDFKTDHVTESTVAAAAERYRLQVQTYAEALSRIYEMPVKAKYLYFFQLGRFVEV